MAENLTHGQISSPMPRVTIQFCTQCKWMLRAAYYAQELLSTFSLSLGEVALQPSTGGIFIVTIHHHTSLSAKDPASAPSSTILWDRKTNGGFPETKELKRRVRDVIEPGRDLGHVDRHYTPAVAPMPLKDTLERGPGPVMVSEKADAAAADTVKVKAECEDCK